MTTSTAKLPDPRPDGWPAYPLAAAVGLYLAGWAVEAFTLPPSGVAVAVVLVAVAAVAGMRAVFHWSQLGPTLCTEAGALGALAVVAAGGWLLVPGGDPIERGGWLLLWWCAVSAWWCALCLRVPAAVASERAHPTTEDVVPVGAGPYEQIVARAGLGDRIRVAATRTVGDGLDVVTLEPKPGGKTVTFSQLQGSLEALTTEATLHWRPAGHQLAEGDVSVHRGADAAEYLLHVARVRTLAGEQAVPVVTPGAARSWCGPHTLGIYEDGQPLDVVFCDARRGGKHGEVIGATGSGKGVSLNNVIGAAVACDDVAVWLIGTEKLTKLAWGWLRPWLSGQTARPVIDRVAGPRVRDALHGLADAYEYCQLCNDGEMGDDARTPAPGRSGLLVFIDEASDLLERRDKIRCHDEVERNASELVAAIRKTGRTGPVQVITANQDNLFDSAGSAGSKGKRNSSIAIVGQVRTAQDASQPLAALPARVDPTKLTDNMLYVETGDESHRAVRAKVRALYGEDTIAAYALACSGWQTGLIPDYAARLAHYAGRWNPLHHDALAAGCRSRGWTWPADPATLTDDTTTDQQAAPPATVADPPPATPDVPEDPMPSDQPADHAPADQWTGADTGWLAELGITLDGPGPDTSDGPGARIPEVDVAGVREIAERVLAAELARVERRPDLPDPLGVVAALAAKDGAPEFIPTATLALALGRMSNDDPPAKRKQAAELLSREIRRDAPWLEPMQKSMGTDPDGKRVRPWGYLRDDLIAAARRWWDEAS